VSRVRLITFGSVPPEWGGGRRGGVATFHAALVETIHGDGELPVEVVGIVSTGSGDGQAPVPMRVIGEGQRREAFLEEVLDELRPDVALLNHFSTSWGLTVPVVAPRLPLVGVAHSWHPVTHAEDREVARERMHRAMGGLSALVVPSEFCLGEGRELGLPYPDVTRVIRYPLQDRFVQPVELDQPRSGVVFAGELIPRKNPAGLLGAAELVPDLTLTIVGEGTQRAALEAMTADAGIADRVRFAGSVDPAAMRAAMSGAEVFCLPSLSESFGIVYIEALACGTPVIGFPTIGEISRACGIDVGIGLEQPTREAIAAAIEQARATRWDRGALRRAALGAYSARDVAAEYAAVLRDACG
jgi:glycosyltransferase involved in cell wall biosynthesis